jgi:hypothetical protein
MLEIGLQDCDAFLLENYPCFLQNDGLV